MTSAHCPLSVVFGSLVLQNHPTGCWDEAQCITWALLAGLWLRAVLAGILCPPPVFILQISRQKVQEKDNANFGFKYPVHLIIVLTSHKYPYYI